MLDAEVRQRILFARLNWYSAVRMVSKRSSFGLLRLIDPYGESHEDYNSGNGGHFDKLCARHILCAPMIFTTGDDSFSTVLRPVKAKFRLVGPCPLLRFGFQKIDVFEQRTFYAGINVSIE